MSDRQISLLLVGPGCRLQGLLQPDADARGYRVTCAPTIGDALAAVDAEQYQAALVDLESGADTGLEALRELKAAAPDLEIIVVSASRSLAPAIRSYELAAFAFVPEPVERAQLVSTIDRALERRRITLHNRRLFWELQTINEIAEGIGRSLELDTVLNGALQRIVRAFEAAAATIRLRDELTGRYEVRARVDTTRAQASPRGEDVDARFSDGVIASTSSVFVEDVARDLAPPAAAELPVRSAVSVPMLAGGELLGTLTVVAAKPFRFHFADERLLSIIAGQIVVAVQNVRLHDSVRRGKREWERTFDAIADPIAVFDKSGALLRGNVALAAFLERPVTELPLLTCREIGFCGGGCPEACVVGQALRHDAPGSAEITLPGGRIFTVTTFPVGASDGVSVVQVATDVTEQVESARQLQRMSDELATTNARLLAAMDQLKSTQAQLLQAEKLSAIGQLVAGVAHELNNPLTSVIGYAQLLEEELRDPSIPPRAAGELAQDLHKVAQESERAARIVRNLLAFARRQTAARLPQDIADLGMRVLSLRSYDLRLHGVQLVTAFDSGLPQVVADGGQLQQALLNLVLNAEQAMRASATRRLTAGARFDEPTASVELFVSDTGHGIEASNLSRIFDPFFTTRDVGEGTGLGLSICYGIVRDHGGEIRVETQVQAGTTFRIRLPARVEHQARGAGEVLVAHGDQADRDFLVAALAGWGYQAMAVSRPEEALARYARGGLHGALVDRGFVSASFAAWGQAVRGRLVPLVLLARAGGEDDIERFGREQANGVLTTPYQLRLLRAAVRALEINKEFA